MPEIKNTFTSGRMNKDFDERLIPKGEYRDALNIDIATSESSDVGTAQNVMGNTRVSTLGIAGQQCIGSIADTKNDKIYWFVSGNSVDAVVEYNIITKKILPVLVDTNKGTSSAMLNFTTDNLNTSNKHIISGINVIVHEDDGGDTTSFLLWTDNKNEPKKVNIERCKSGSTNYSTTTKLFIDGDDRGNILEEHITVIKKSPLNAPDVIMYKTTDASRDQSLSMSATFTSGTEYDEFGNYRACSTTDPNDPVGYAHCDFTKTINAVLGGGGSNEEVAPRIKGTRLIEHKYTGDPAQEGAGAMQFFSSGRLMYEAGNTITLTSKSVDTRIQTYTVRVRLLTMLREDANSKTFNAEIIHISEDLTTASLVWECVLEQGDSLFELIFPRFGYRWKYVDGQYSCFSPFSKVAFLPDQEQGFEYSPVDAYNLSMVNYTKAMKIAGGTTLPFDTRPKDVVEVDVLYKESNTTNVYTIATFKTKEEMDIVETDGEGFVIDSEQVHAVVPSNQLLRPWDNVPRKARSQEISKNRVIYGNYLQNFNVPENPKFIITPSVTKIHEIMGTESLKSIRNYQVGIVFLDKYGRQTPVLSDNTGAFKLDQTYSVTANKLSVQVFGDPNSAPPRNLVVPPWATHYRYFLKEPSLEYYNLAMDRFYIVEDGTDHVWISFASAERNKVDEESYLILKKRHESDDPLDMEPAMTYKYKVISLKNEAPDSIKKRKRRLGEVTTQFGRIEGIVGADPGIGFPEEDSMFFNVPSDTIEGSAIEEIGSENPTELYIKIASPRSETGYYRLTGISNPSGFWKFSLARPFGSDVSFTLDADGDEVAALSLEVYKEDTIDLTEFEGRFFVKLRRDNFIDENLLSREQVPRYAKLYGVNLHYIHYVKSDTINSALADYQSQASEKMYGSKLKTDANPEILTSAFSIDNAVFYTADVDGDGEPDYRGATKLGTGQDVQLGAMGDGKNKSFIRLTNAGTHGQLPTEHPTIDMFRSEDDYNFHIALTTPGTIFRFKNDPRNDGDGVVQEIIDTDRILVYNYKEKRRRNGRWRLADKERRKKSNHGLQYEITTRPAGQKNDEGLGWTPLSPHFDGAPTIPLDLSARGWRSTDGEKPMHQKVNAEFAEEVEILKEIKNELTFSSRNPAIWETEPKPTVDLDLYYETGKTYPIANLGSVDIIEYSNCWSFGNGAESNRIRDDYNAVYVDKGPRVSSVLAEQYKEERRSSGLIYSGIYNSQSGVNRLNQFIQAEKITKDINPEYGSIQKLHARDSDLLVLCEDKCLKVLAHKDALYNADGNMNLTATSNVLGQSIPFIGDYGISTNPESFANHGFRSYFTDKRRGAVLRLSRDGLTNIAYKGMRDWFSDNMKQPIAIMGNYDEKKDNYNISLIGSSNNTLSFSEMVGGWTSFKSFVPESGLTLNNTYFTFNSGDLWEHNKNSLRNNFYGLQYDSTVKLIFNDSPSATKNFKTLNYEGTTSRLYKTVERGFSAGNDTTVDLEGWYCNSITTGEQDGDVPYFINKEGKWFANLHGSTITTTDLQSADAAKEFKVQGIGNCSTCTGTARAGCVVRVSVVMDASDDTSDNNFDLPTAFTIGGTSYNNTTDLKTYTAGATVSANAIFTFEPHNANTGNAAVMKAADFAFVSESSSTVTDAVTDGSVAFADTVSAYATNNKVTMTVPLSFTMPSNDQTIEVRITGRAPHVRTVAGTWYSIVSNTSVPSESNTTGTAFSASGLVGETVTIDLDPADGAVTTTTFTAGTDYIFKGGTHPFIDLTGCYIAGSNYRVTETPVFGSTGTTASKVFALTYKIPDYNVTDDIINFYAESSDNSTAETGRITNFTIDGQTKDNSTTTISASATSATQTVADTSGIEIGSSVIGNGVPQGSQVKVNSITNSTELVLSESITTTSDDTYTFILPSIIPQGGAIGKSLKVYGDAGAIFDIFLVRDDMTPPHTSLLTDSDGDTVSSIRGQIPAIGGNAYYEEVLNFPHITSGSATYTLTLEAVTGSSRFISPLLTPEKIRFVQYIDCVVTLTASESNSAFSLSATALGSSTDSAFHEASPPNAIVLSTILTSSTADANLRFLDGLDTSGDGELDELNYANWTNRDKDDDDGTIALTNGSVLSFDSLNIVLDNTLSNATATLSGTAHVHQYGSASDTSDLNFDDLLGFEVSTNPGLIGTSVGTGIYDIPVTVGAAAGQFEVAFNAGAIPDRFQILFDSAGLSNDIDDMEVVADSLHVGDYLHVAGTGTDSRGEFRAGAGGSYVGAINTHTGVKKYMFVGTGGDSSLGGGMGGFWDDNGTTTVTIAAADIAGPDSDTPNSDVRASGASNHGNQIGCTNYYYNSDADFNSVTKQTHPSPNIYSDDGHVTLIYNKGVTTSTRAYIRCRSYSGHNSSTTGWFIYGHRFTSS